MEKSYVIRKNKENQCNSNQVRLLLPANPVENSQKLVKLKNQKSCSTLLTDLSRSITMLTNQQSNLVIIKESPACHCPHLANTELLSARTDTSRSTQSRAKSKSGEIRSANNQMIITPLNGYLILRRLSFLEARPLDSWWLRMRMMRPSGRFSMKIA